MPERAKIITDRTNVEGYRRSAGAAPRSFDDVIRPRSVRPPRSRGTFLRETTPISQPLQEASVKQPAMSADIVSRPKIQSAPTAARQQKSAVLHRQFVQPQQVSKTPKKRKFKRPSTQLVLIIMAVIIFISGTVVSLQTVKTNNETNKQVQALANVASDNEESVNVPSNDKPSVNEYKNYKVAPELARYIKIPKLSVDTRVLQVGLTKKNAIDAPSNIHDAAWYTGSSKPGNPGATVIDGHVSGWKTKGVFSDIKKLSKGDDIQIVKGDGKTLTYKVVKVKVYDADKVDMKAAMLPVNPDLPGLNLITCDGHVESSTHEFDKRVVVFAQLQN